MADASLTHAEQKAAWLAQRRTMLTGTDAAKVLALTADPKTAEELARYGGPMDVFLDKTTEVPERADNDAMRAGRYLERPILEMFAERDPDHVIPLVFEPPFTIRRSMQYNFIGASLDAMRLDDPAPVDAKNLRRLDARKWGPPGSDEIPLYYAVQLVMQMHVTDAEYAQLAVLVSGQDLMVYTLWRDRETEADVLHKLYDFWHLYVVPRVPPPVDGTPAWTEHLRKKFTRATDVLREATQDDHRAAQRLLAAKERLEHFEREKATAENLLKQSIGEAAGIMAPGWKALWTPSKESSGTDWEAVARHFALMWLGDRADAAIAEETAKHQIVTRKASRRFTFTATKTE